MTTPEERVKVLQSENRRLEQYLTELPPEAWERPSACERWTVADVVAHLTRHNRNYSSRIMRALQGDASPDEPAHGRRASGEMDAEESANRIIAFRNELGDQLFAEFLKGNQAMDQALAEVGPQDWDRLMYRGVGTEPLRNIVDVFITERTIHGWDIRSRFEPSARLSLEPVPIIVERIPQRPRWWSFRLGPGFSPLPLRYRFEITSPLAYNVDVVVLAEDQQYMEVGSQEPPQVAFRCDGETFIMVIYGRLKTADAIGEGRLLLEGNEDLAAEFVQRFTGG